MMSKRSIIVVIQSRLSSKRLPAKALLPLAGYPVVVLCALRAANTGLPTIVAISSEPSDDFIANVLYENNIRYCRGSLDDVLYRFTQAVTTYHDTDWVVRLTADNVLPDGHFLDFLLTTFDETQFDYLGVVSSDVSLPYGLSAEIFKVGVLREANKKASTKLEREHVTPYIKKHFRCQPFSFAKSSQGWGELRCTLDDFSDYIQLLRLFQDVKEPLNIPWEVLVEKLECFSFESKKVDDKRKKTSSAFGECFVEVSEIEKFPHQMEKRCHVGMLEKKEQLVKNLHPTKYDKLTLGTAQLGIAYGIANQLGFLCEEAACDLIYKAVSSGIKTLDTARAYGLSEQRIGNVLNSTNSDIKIISKLHPLEYLSDDASPEQVRFAVRASVYETCYQLKTAHINVLLLHRWEHRYKWHGMVWDELILLKKAGLIEKIGASIATPGEAMNALLEYHIEYIQCPVNILDWRWHQADFLTALSMRQDVVFFARSVYLQGLLTLDAKAWPRFPEIDIHALNRLLDDFTKRFHRINRRDLCLAYVRGIPWIASLVIGMETEVQLQENMALFENAPLTLDEIETIRQELPLLPENFLDPAQWRL
ncbi:MAG: aldo/keto reductase [Legionellaceae bacterium]|nr:aldo/keto reductase [Legionellaceae bacterium]